MPGLEGVAAGQIGDGAGDPERAVRAACGPSQAARGGFKKLPGLGRERGKAVQVLALQCLVGHALAGLGSGTGGLTAFTHAGGALAICGAQQLLGRQRGDFDLQVDAVQKRAAQAHLVAPHLLRAAAAGALG